MRRLQAWRTTFACMAIVCSLGSLGCAGKARFAGGTAGSGLQAAASAGTAGLAASMVGSAGAAGQLAEAGRGGAGGAGRGALIPVMSGGAGAGAGAGGVAASAGAGGSGASPDASGAALTQLTEYLAKARADRPKLDTQAFATVPLTRSDADKANQMLWQDLAAWVRSSRMGEMGATESRAASFSLDGHTLRYYMALRGNAPANGRSLFISMHGGGNAGASTNDQQWNNQISLVDGYKPQDAIWVAPRAPSDAGTCGSRRTSIRCSNA